MLTENFIATTALSSFNNAALYGPFFFIVGVFTLPLLWAIYLNARSLKLKIGWNSLNIDNQVSFWSSWVLVLWLLLFGGNYAVIRDGISLLPVLIGFVLFFMVAIGTQKGIQLDYVSGKKNGKIRLLILLTLLILAGVSGYGNWWCAFLQISAVSCGAIVGLFSKRNIFLIPLNVLILTLFVVLVLMQPEFFRFGQLGNLTVVHLLSIVMPGFFAITTLTTKYTKARDRIHQSAYIKLKWLFRIMSLLALVLFVLTESVPIFIGLIAIVGLLEMLSIYHSQSVVDGITKQSFANLLIWVGIIIICPALSGIGVLYLASVSKKAKVSDFTALL